MNMSRGRGGGGAGGVGKQLLSRPEWTAHKGHKKERKEPPSEVTPSEQRIRQQVDGWPDSLKEFVNNCYVLCKSNQAKDKMSCLLKEKILKATEDGSLWTKRWDVEPLPGLEEQQAKTRTRIEHRLGPVPERARSRSRSPSKRKKKERRGRSESSSSSSSRDSFISFSPNKKKGKGGKKVSSKGKQNKYQHDMDKSHYWSEYGMLGSGQVETRKEVLDKRAARFGGDRPRPPAPSVASPAPQPQIIMDTDAEFDLSSCHIVGTSTAIEKPYLRLTSAPEAHQVRPPHVLVQALTHTRTKWLQSQDYRYVCEQLKSIRQDLTVQGIRDNLTVEVYETHARIALEKGDNAEFNQCQSQLAGLHRELSSTNRHEFTAYRLLYYILTQQFIDMTTMMTSLSREEKEERCVRHAIDVTKAWLTSNHHWLFTLYGTAPNMSSYLMDWFLPRERKLALKTIIKAFRPTFPTLSLKQRLGFETDAKLWEFLDPLGLVFSDEGRTSVDCKASSGVITF